jgi:hypothetical protein
VVCFYYYYFQLYVDFEDAFQDEAVNTDYFGLQFTEPNSHPSTNVHLQSIETISEVKNTNLSPYIRYQASRETSHPSSHQHHSLSPDVHTNLNRDFTNLNLLHNNNNDSPAPFTPDAIRYKIKQQEIPPNPSPQIPLNLPQYFLVKYLGRTLCTQLWGAKVVRTPIDDMVRNARQLSSMNEIPTLEICVNTHGLTLTHRTSSNHNKHRHHSPERHQHGLIPLENISYAMHDMKYSKISSCIVLRQLKNDHINVNETITECYAFLFQSKDHAHRFALGIAEAFKLQNQPTTTKPSRSRHDDRREGRSPQRRSRHQSTHHHHHRTRHHLRDSEV